jgi:hypothetical protein
VLWRHRHDVVAKRLDIVELPEIFLPSWPSRFPYVTRLHAAAWTYRRLCGEPVELADIVEQRFESYTLHRASAISSPSKALAAL